MVVTADGGIAKTAPWDNVYIEAERQSTSPYWGYEYRFNTGSVLVDDVSTYQFTYELPESLITGEDAEIPVAFESDVVRAQGYDGVRFAFAARGRGT